MGEKTLYQVFVPEFAVGEQRVPMCGIWIRAENMKGAADIAVTQAVYDRLSFDGDVPKFAGPNCLVFEANEVRRQIDRRLTSAEQIANAEAAISKLKPIK